MPEGLRDVYFATVGLFRGLRDYVAHQIDTVRSSDGQAKSLRYKVVFLTLFVAGYSILLGSGSPPARAPQPNTDYMTEAWLKQHTSLPTAAASGTLAASLADADDEVLATAAPAPAPALPSKPAAGPAVGQEDTNATVVAAPADATSSETQPPKTAPLAEIPPDAGAIDRGATDRETASAPPATAMPPVPPASDDQQDPAPAAPAPRPTQVVTAARPPVSTEVICIAGCTNGRGSVVYRGPPIGTTVSAKLQVAAALIPTSMAGSQPPALQKVSVQPQIATVAPATSTEVMCMAGCYSGPKAIPALRGPTNAAAPPQAPVYDTSTSPPGRIVVLRGVSRRKVYGGGY